MMAFGLQQLFERQLHEQFEPSAIAVLLLEKKLDIELTSEQCAFLKGRFSEPATGSDILSFDFTEAQLRALGLTSDAAAAEKLQRAMDELPDALDSYLNNALVSLDETVVHIADGVSVIMVPALRKQMPAMIAQQEAMQQTMQDEVSGIWGAALNLLQAFIVLTDEAAEIAAKDPTEASQGESVSAALIRMQGRASQIAKEILVLLQCGYADGAHARWRSLHELAVTAMFVHAGGNELARAYLDHYGISRYKASLQYNAHCLRLNAPPYTAQEMEAFTKDYERLLTQYGKPYRHDYGWAANCLGMEKPTFKDIERHVKLDHLSPYYRMASSNVHAQADGILCRLGLLREDDAVLAGPSNVGMGDPGQGAVISLLQVSTCLLTYRPSLDQLVICKILSEFAMATQREFASAQENFADGTDDDKLEGPDQ